MPKLRLKDLRLNQVPFYYQAYDGTVDEVDEDGNLTGESIPKYSNPVRVLASDHDIIITALCFNITHTPIFNNMLIIYFERFIKSSRSQLPS